MLSLAKFRQLDFSPADHRRYSYLNRDDWPPPPVISAEPLDDEEASDTEASEATKDAEDTEDVDETEDVEETEDFEALDVADAPELAAAGPNNLVGEVVCYACLAHA